MTTDFLAIPHGAKHKAAAQKLMSWMLDANHQAAHAKATHIGPSNTKALAMLDAETRDELPTYHFQKGELITRNDEFWAANFVPAYRTLQSLEARQVVFARRSSSRVSEASPERQAIAAGTGIAGRALARAGPALLGLPGIFLILAFFVLPVALILAGSVFSPEFTLAQYEHVFGHAGILAGLLDQHQDRPDLDV